MKRFSFLALAIMACAIPVLTFQATPQTSNTAGTIRGLVVRDGTGDPIPDVQIVIGSRLAQAAAIGRQAGMDAALISFGPQLVETTIRRGGFAAIPAVAGDTTPQFTAVSDASGRFVIEGVPAGDYAVTAQREGFFAPQSNASVPSLVRSSVIVTSQQAVNLTVSMVPGAAMSGRVTGVTGSPSVSSPVVLLKTNYRNALPVLQLVSTKQTDDRGEYRLFQLPPGDYYLAAAPRQEAIASGLARTATSWQETPMRTFYPGATDVAQAVPLVLHGGEDLTGMNLQIRTAAVATISGRVINGAAAQAAQGRGNVATLSFVPHDKYALADLVTIESATVSMASPNDGVFRITNVPMGTYDLFASLPNGRQSTAVGRTLVDVRGENMDDIRITVHPGVDVTGSVTVDGKPMNANVRIALQPNDSAARISEFQAVSIAFPSLESDGSFKIPGVPEAAYRFVVTVGLGPSPQAGRGARGAPAPQPPSPLPPSAYVADIRQGGVSIYDDGFRVATEQVLPVEIVLSTNGARIDGVVVGSDLLPVAGGAVVLVPSQARRQNPGLFKAATTGARGEFNLVGVPPGQYKLFAWPALPPDYQSPDFIKRLEDQGVSVTLAVGAQTSLRLTLLKLR